MELCDKTNNPLPANLEVRYSGFATKEIAYINNAKSIDISLEEESIQIDVVEVKGQRVSDKQKSSFDCGINGFISYKGDTSCKFL